MDIWGWIRITETLQIPSTTQSGVIYNLTINSETNEARCNCTGFLTHGYCKHMRVYKNRISKLLYGSDFVDKIIRSFNNCYDFIIQLCDSYPECIGDYDRLDFFSGNMLGAVGKHYRTETIHRAYRLAVENGEIQEPTVVQIRKEKAEATMHNINQWSAKTFVGVNNDQSVLLPSEGVSTTTD